MRLILRVTHENETHWKGLLMDMNYGEIFSTIIAKNATHIQISGSSNKEDNQKMFYLHTQHF